MNIQKLCYKLTANSKLKLLILGVFMLIVGATLLMPSFGGSEEANGKKESDPITQSNKKTSKEEKELVKVLEQIYVKTSNKAKPWIYPDLFVSESYVFPISRTEKEWEAMLSEFEYYVLRQQGTERAGSGEYDKFYEKGIYYSSATGQPLFSSEDKYDSKTGWPSFTKPVSADSVHYRLDKTLFSTRIEVIDSLSGSHLGHVFEDGPDSTGLRYCMNSISLVFVPEGEPAPQVLTSNK